MKIILLLTIVYTNLLGQTFTRIFGDPVVSDDRYSEGSSWGDINNDGYIDLFVPDLHSETNILFTNNGDGTFTQLTTGPVVTDIGRSSGGSFGDFDNDGDLDLFVSNYYDENNQLYINDGSGGYTKVTSGSIVVDGGMSFGSSVVDYDNDGYLDIYVVNGALTPSGANNFLYKNNGNGTFTRITAGPIVNDGQQSSSSSWCDYDNDGDQDLFVANGFTYDPAQADNAIYKNNGDGTFVEINLVSIGIDHSYSSNGSWGDFDNDGDFDLFVTNFLGNNNNLYKNNGDGTFTKVTSGIIVNDGGDSVSSIWGDYDNDGDLDLYVTNDYNEDNDLYQNDGDATFTKITVGDPVNDGGRSNGATWADFNNDGHLDLFVPNGQRPVSQNNILYRNNGSNNSWVNIRFEGTASNKTAIGTIVRAKAFLNSSETWQVNQVSGSTGFNAQNSFNVEFGFGDATIVDSLIFKWPSGTTEVYTNVAVDQFYEAIEGVGLDPVLTSVKHRGAIPQEFELYQNYPNPFNPSTTIRFRIPTNSYVKLAIYNTLGEMVKTLLNEQLVPNEYDARWDGRNDSDRMVSGGIYFMRLSAASETGLLADVKKIVYLK